MIDIYGLGTKIFYWSEKHDSNTEHITQFEKKTKAKYGKKKSKIRKKEEKKKIIFFF